MVYRVPEVEIAAAPKVTLGGKEWPIPKLAPRQQRLIVPALLAIMPTLGMIIAAVESKDPMAIAQMQVNDDVYDKIVDVVYAALTRADPELKKEDFLDIAIDARDMFAALPVVMAQTGMMERAKPGDKPAGETQAGT